MFNNTNNIPNIPIHINGKDIEQTKNLVSVSDTEWNVMYGH